MKKRFNLLLLLFLLLIPFIAKADMSAPLVRSYEAIVIKVDGVDYYELNTNWSFSKKGHLDKDTKILIEYEMTEDDVVYLSFSKDGDYYYVESNDVKPLEGEVKPDSDGVEKLDSKQIIRIEAKDGVLVKKGPSVAYETVGTLKKGTEATYRYEISESGYIYVDVGDVKGWILTLEGAVLFYGGDYILANDIELTCGKVPANTILKNVWYTDVWSGDVLVEYNDCKDYYHWFKDPNFVVYGSYISGKASEEIIIYEKPNMEKQIGIIAKDTKVSLYSENYYADEYDPDVIPMVYVEASDKKGWIASDENELYDVERIKDEKEEVVEVEEPKEKETDKKESKKWDTKTIVIVCVVGALAFALGAIATIVLVNRKNKKAKQKEDVVEVTNE